MLIAVAALYGLWQSAVRVARVEIVGGDPALAAYARIALSGAYFGLVPRDSIFFLPESRIRSAILEAHPEIATVSIARDGFTGITISLEERTPVARWCGVSYAASSTPEDASCYFFDPTGYLFAQAGSSTQSVNPFVLYAPLVSDAAGSLGTSVASADRLPAAFDFARELGAFGSPVTAVALHDGEADYFLASGTRVTDVLGSESGAYTALVSARADFNLADGSVEYVDLRFNGKIYLKRKEAPTKTQ